MAHRLIILVLCLSAVQAGGQAQDISELVAATVEASEKLRTQDKDIAAAIQLLEPVLDSLEQHGEHSGLTLVPLYHKLGINYYLHGVPVKAEYYIDKALTAREAAYGKFHIDVARGYYMRAIANKELQQFGQAEKDLESAASAMRELVRTGMSKDTFRLIWTYEERIRLYSNLRNNTLALQFWHKTFDHYNRNEAANFPDLIALYKNKGHIYYNQQKFDLAEQAYYEAIRLYDRYGQPAALLRSIAGVYSDLGISQFKQGNYAAAERSYQTARAQVERLMKDNESPWMQQMIGVIYANMLELAGETGNDAMVEEYFARALDYYQKGCGTFHHPLIATLYQNMVEISLAKGELPNALEFNQKSLRALLPDFTSEEPLALVDLTRVAVKDKLSLLETLRQKSAILMAMYSRRPDEETIKAAFGNYRTLDTVITQVRQSYNAAGSQFELIEQSYSIYEQAIRTALTLYEQKQAPRYLEDAYHYAAKNKALVLLGGMQEEQAKAFSSIPEALKAEEKYLKKSIFELESELYSQDSEGNKQALKDSLFARQRSHQQLIDRFEENYPDYYATKYGFDRRIELTTLQERLDRETTVIEYFVGEENVFVFLLTKEGLDYVMLNKPTDFETHVQAFRTQIQSRLRTNEAFLEQGYQLYQWLLEHPLARPIAAGSTHLLIIPDGALLQLPFDALVENTNSTPSYILNKYAVSYAYSNRLLFQPAKNQRAAKIFAGYGLEYDDYTLAGLAEQTNTPAAGWSLSRALGKLQYSDNEVQEIAALLAGEQWINEAATRQSFTENADQYAILHLAMHGILNEEYPMNSALVFSRSNDTIDYFLRAADIYNMQLNAEMVVLSACNTGAGSIQKGEGVRSLARAFSFAGCPSMVASLWNASDKSTKDILLDFYRYLKKGNSKDEAMRQAKLAYLENAPSAYRSPYYWSHLSVIGDHAALEVLAPGFGEQYGYWLLGGLVLVLLGGLYVNRLNQ